MEKTFGQEYIQYKNKVSLIIPYLKLNVKLFSRIISERKTRLLAYTILYILLLTICYCLIDPYVVMYR